MANLLKLLNGLITTRNISSAIDTLLGASDGPAAREAIGATGAVTDFAGVTQYTANLQSIASGEFFSVLNLTGSYEIIAGAAFGPAPGLRITIDGVAATFGGVAAGYGRLGDDWYGVAIVPHCVSSTSLQIEIQNTVSGTREYGARIKVKAL